MWKRRLCSEGADLLQEWEINLRRFTKQGKNTLQDHLYLMGVPWVLEDAFLEVGELTEPVLVILVLSSWKGTNVIFNLLEVTLLVSIPKLQLCL